MAQPLRIDLVVDITCPWSLLGLLAIINAAAGLRDEVDPQLYIQPFELNPELGPEGANAIDHARTKYNAELQQIEAGRQQTKSLAARYNFAINQDQNTRIWNTRDAHRLLYWAHVDGKALPLLLAFYTLYFTEQRSLADHAVLLHGVKIAGFDVERARAVLSTGQYDADVHAKEQAAFAQGIIRAPTAILQEYWRVEGAQPPQIYGGMMRDIVRGVLKREQGSVQ